MDDVDQFFRGLGARIVARCRGIHHVFADMVLDHLGDEAVECAAAGRRLLQDRAARAVGVEQAFDGIDLTAYASKAIQQLGFLSANMVHSG